MTGITKEQALVVQLRNFAQGCRGSMWQSRAETIRLCDEAADTLIAALDERDAAEATATALTAQVEKLRAFIEDFASAKIEALRIDMTGLSPEDEPDPVVEATEVWAWQEDARTTLKETPNA